MTFLKKKEKDVSILHVEHTKTYKLALHIFRRDLRIDDNTALMYALKHAEKVIPCFIFDPRQVKDNPYKSNNAITFMVHSLYELIDQLSEKGGRLYILYGVAEEVVEKLSQQLPLELVTFNKDYTRFALKRDTHIKNICMRLGIDCRILPDVLLNEPHEVCKKDGTPYTVFTPFFKCARKRTVDTPRNNTATNYYIKNIDEEGGTSLLARMLPPNNPYLALHGGRKEATRLLQKIKELTHYKDLRNMPAQGYTSHLSAHHKFGTISIRETYHSLKQVNHEGSGELLRQLYWRDFFVHIAYYFSHIWEGPFHRKYRKIAWNNDPALFQKWCEGKTGFPMVDAGMHELNTTGYMHNRVRMIAASFLIKNLHIGWRWGEKYFAQKLTDYDPAVNNGNWQWVASTGCDAQPYFRIFNPWLQQARFDPDCIYIKKWLPQLEAFTAAQIHNIPKKLLNTDAYPAPIVDHAVTSSRTKSMYNV